MSLVCRDDCMYAVSFTLCCVRLMSVESPFCSVTMVRLST